MHEQDQRALLEEVANHFVLTKRDQKRPQKVIFKAPKRPSPKSFDRLKKTKSLTDVARAKKIQNWQWNTNAADRFEARSAALDQLYKENTYLVDQVHSHLSPQEKRPYDTGGKEKVDKTVQQAFGTTDLQGIVEATIAPVLAGRHTKAAGVDEKLWLEGVTMLVGIGTEPNASAAIEIVRPALNERLKEFGIVTPTKAMGVMHVDLPLHDQLDAFVNDAVAAGASIAKRAESKRLQQPSQNVNVNGISLRGPSIA